MSNIRIDLEINHEPVVLEMVVDRVRQQHFKCDAYGQATMNRLVFSNANKVLCLFVDDSLTNRQLKGLSDEFKRRQPRIAGLGHPIVALHYIEAGRGWPEDANSDVVSILNRLPDDRWTMMASKPPVVTHHPLINQPAGTIAFECNMSAGMPVVISYDAIASADQINRWVIVNLHVEGNGELLGCAAIRLKHTTAAMGLADSLRLRRVKRLIRNELVEAIMLYPKPERCRGLQRCANLAQGMVRSHEELICNAREAHPDDIRNAIKKHRAS